MARTKATSARGTKLAYSDSSGGSYTPVGELTSVGQPEITAPTTSATHYESDNNAEEKIFTGYTDVNDVPFTANWEDDQYATLQGLIGTEKYWKITTRDTSTYVFYGGISSLGGGDFPMKDTVRVTGKITVLKGEVTFTGQAS